PPDLCRVLRDPRLADDQGLPERHQIARRLLRVRETSARCPTFSQRSSLAPSRLLERPSCVVLLDTRKTSRLAIDPTGQTCPERFALTLADARFCEAHRVLGANR